MALQPDLRGTRFGPFWLSPGISRLNGATYFYSTFIFVTLVTFLNFLQPYILNEILHIPAGRQGTVTGVLNFLHEGTALLVMGLIGALSDRTGRRLLCAAGFMVMAVGFVVFPLAGGEYQLYVYRLILAVGTAAVSVMIIAALQDYPQEPSRGRWNGLHGVFTGVGVLIVALVLVRLPAWFSGPDHSATEAGRFAFWIAAGLATLSALAIRLGYYGGVVAEPGRVHPPFAGLLAGFREARHNPRMALAYGGAFAARGDLVVIGAFLSLWFVRAGGDAGMSTGVAVIKAGFALVALQLAVMVWAPLFGQVLDRINRVSGLAIAMTLAALGYFVIGRTTDPFDFGLMLPAAALLGVGEISAVISGNALLGQEAPVNIRGAAVGVFGFCGTLGILFATLLGGQVFDRVGYAAPFTMMAGVNAAVAVWALLVRFR